jgi:hypothetical protein
MLRPLLLLLCCGHSTTAAAAAAGAGDVEDVSSEELPVLAAALASMEYRDPFLLTALAGAATPCAHVYSRMCFVRALLRCFVAVAIA